MASPAPPTHHHHRHHHHRHCRPPQQHSHAPLPLHTQRPSQHPTPQQQQQQHAPQPFISCDNPPLVRLTPAPPPSSPAWPLSQKRTHHPHHDSHRDQHQRNPHASNPRLARRAWLASIAGLAVSATWQLGAPSLVVEEGPGGVAPGGAAAALPRIRLQLGGTAAQATQVATAAGDAGALAPGTSAVDLRTLQEEAYLAYAERRFQAAVDLLTECVAAEPGNPRWREMRAEALVDGKNFQAAVADFEAAMELVPGDDRVTRARLLSGRALAYEGLSEWEAALADYRRGMELAAAAGESLDPYVLNSIGNCYNSLGRWQEAREQYLASAEVFQAARGFRGRNGSTSPRLDGAIFASSNAALMRAQLGDTDGAVQEMVRIARRAPGSADMRAALAALYWEQGRRQEAEEMWEFACDRITVGCTKYTDPDWLGRIRRWPPAMVAKMGAFLGMR